MRRLKRVTSVATAAVVAFSSLLSVGFAPTVFAATVAWDGEGSDNKFSTAANWAGDVVPIDGDTITFPSSVDADTTADDDRVLDNDLTSFAPASIQFTGTYAAQDYDYYEIGGNALSLSGGITSADGVPQVNTNLTLTGNQTFSGLLTIGGGLSTPTLALGSYTLTVNSPDDDCIGVTLNTTISGTGGITKTGAGSLKIYKANAYTGPTTVSTGTLTLRNKDGLGGTAGGTTVASGAVLGYSFADAQTIDEPLTIGGASALIDFDDHLCAGGFGDEELPTVTLAGSVTLTANTTAYLGATNLKLTGALSGSFTLGAAQGSQGTIIIESSSNTSSTANGTLEAAAFTTEYTTDQSATSVLVLNKETAVVTGKVGSVFLAKGGVLKGTGTTGDLFISKGGTVAPGMSPGCLNTGALTQGGTYAVEIGGADACSGYDQLKVTGTVDLTDGTLTVARFNDFKPVAGQKYTIIDNDAADAVTGTFTGLAEGATVTIDGYVLSVTYKGGDGNDVVLTVQTVPAAPDTGFAAITANPLVTLAGSVLAAAAILLVAQRSRKLQVRR